MPTVAPPLGFTRALPANARPARTSLLLAALMPGRSTAGRTRFVVSANATDSPLYRDSVYFADVANSDPSMPPAQ